jgi:2-oxo-4-hydroxy-4-carboxy--5-ureidoimidazoline (OHCU) decarboxylase
MLRPIEELNALEPEEFTAALAELFEGAPRFCGRLADGRPYADYDELLVRARSIASEMPTDEQIELIDSHPRIGADPRTVSAVSYREQGYDRDSGTAHLQRRLDELNDQYERRFGFRFVVYVAGRPRSEIADVMEGRMSASREEELDRALSDIFAIARDRAVKLAPKMKESV